MGLYSKIMGPVARQLNTYVTRVVDSYAPTKGMKFTSLKDVFVKTGFTKEQARKMSAPTIIKGMDGLQTLDFVFTRLKRGETLEQITQALKEVNRI